jgi:hypothetical protein
VARRARLSVLPGLAAAALVLVAGCALNTTPRPSQLHQEAGLNVTGAALRIEVRALVGPYVGQIEAAADDAARRCGGDPSVRIRALEWKLNAVALGQNALLQPDPVVALVDGWAYAVQMRDFLGGDRGLAALGACHRDAAAAMDRLGREEVGIVTRFAPESVGRITELVQRWAAAHPLPSLSAPRATAAEVLATASARQNLGALAAVGTMVETLDDLVVRVAAYRETLNKELRWAGELAAAQAGASDLATRALADADRITGAADRIGALAAGIPALVERERRAALVALSAERAAAMADIDAQRLDTLKALQAQTDAVMGRLDAMSRGVMDRVDATSRTAIEEVGGRAEHVVDHVFLRAAQVGLALVALLLVGALLVVRTLGVRLRWSRA